LRDGTQASFGKEVDLVVGQVHQGIKDFWGELEQVEGLGDACSGHAQMFGQVRLGGISALVEKTFENERLFHRIICGLAEGTKARNWTNMSMHGPHRAGGCDSRSCPMPSRSDATRPSPCRYRLDTQEGQESLKRPHSPRSIQAGDIADALARACDFRPGIRLGPPIRHRQRIDEYSQTAPVGFVEKRLHRHEITR